MPRSHSADTVGRSTLFSLLAEVIRVGAAAALTLFLVRALGPHGYGLYALAISIGVVAGVLADFGVAASTSRFVAERLGDRMRMADVIRDGLRVNLAISAAVALALAALAVPIAKAYGQTGLVDPLRAIAIATFTQSVFQVLVAVCLGMRRNDLQARLYTLQGVTETTTAITFVALGGGAAAALLGQSLGYAAAVALGLAAVLRLLGPAALPRRRGAGHARRILGYARSTLILNVAFTLFAQIDVLLITAYLGAIAAGQFQAPSRLILMFLLIGQAVSNAVSPRAALYRTEPQSVAAVLGGLRALSLLGLLGATVLTVWSAPIVNLALGPGYGPSSRVLLASGPFVFFGMLGPLVTVSLTYLGFARKRVPIAVAALLLQVALDVILIPALGIVGAAVASDVVYGLYVAAHFRILQRVLGLDLRVLSRTLLRGLGAAGAMAAVLAAAGTGPRLSLPAAALGGLAGLAVFVAVLSATGELRLSEIRAAGRALRSRKAAKGPDPSGRESDGEGR